MSPLILLVGFLGSGKTTYLRKLLPELQKQGLRPHVVINDYQNARVDASLLQEVTDFVKPISGSCVCCESSEELLNTVGEIPLTESSVLLIETNGTTDAEELIAQLTLDPRVSRFTLPWQVNLIDGKRWQKRFWHNGLERDQYQTATHYFISREETAGKERVALVEHQLAEVNDAAVKVTPEELATEIKDLVGRVGKLSSRAEVEHAHEHEHDHDHAHEHEHDHGHNPGHAHGHQATHHFASAELVLPGLVDRRALLDFLKGLPDGVLRAKGLVRLQDSPEKVHLFQRVEADEDVLFVALAEPSLIPPLLVLIGVNLPLEEIRQQLAKMGA